MTLWAFLGISTNPVYERSLSIAEAEQAVRRGSPSRLPVLAGERHSDILQRSATDGQTAEALMMDAALAAIAVEHGAMLYTTDRDFARFSELKWTNRLRVLTFDFTRLMVSSRS